MSAEGAVLVRAAQQRDLPELKRLMRSFLELTASELIARGDSLDYVLTSPRHVLLVATTPAEVIIGFASASTRRVARHPNPITEIDELYVSPAFRRRGAARQLVRATAAHAREARSSRLFVASHATRTEAHNCYTALGFESNGLYFRLTLGAHSSRDWSGGDAS